jgi:hypothetical protein
MAPPELRMAFVDLPALEREIASNLKHGRAFLGQAADVQVLSDCCLVLVHPLHGAQLRLPAQVVMVSASGPMCGTGIELRPFGPAVIEQLEAFVHAPADEAADDGSAETEASVAAPRQAESQLQTETEAETDTDLEAQTDQETSSEGTDAFEDDAQLDAELERELQGKSIPPDQQLQSRQDKLRHLTPAEQLKLARTGELADRVTLERLYGKQVWEALLHNPRLSIPEVARIARKGTVPKPLLEVILDNGAWVKSPQVKRALLGNPKLGADAIGKLLRTTPKHELKLIEKGTAYAMPVREAARKLLKQ